MTKPPVVTSDDLIRFVRGEKPWRMLASRGIDIEFVGKTLRAKSSGKAAVRPNLRDIAIGFARHRTEPEVTREWAAVMLALDEIDLSELDDNPDGEALKEALWDASGDEKVSNAAWMLVDQLSAESSR